MAKHLFCTDLCLERGEPLAGTGDAPRRALMLAWPRGQWRSPRWESIGMSAQLSAALHAAAKGGLHVALIDKVEAEDSLPTLHAVPEGIKADFEDEAELIKAIADYVEGKVFQGRFDPRQVIIVCTDSRRDACCARHGFSTYKALVAAADPEKFHIVQATHIGGCRFAASLIVMPQRQRYGRMTAAQAPAFLAALEQGRIYLPAYKGRTDSPEPIQVAEIAAMSWAEEQGQLDQTVHLHGDLPDDPGEGATLTLEAEIAGTTLAIRMRAQTFFMQGNCSIVSEGRGEDTVRWCLDGVTRLSPAELSGQHPPPQRVVQA